MLYVIVLMTMLFSAIQAIRTAHLINSALWLACVSALLATVLYGVGAHEIAVIELSVGAGLVTVLFVFAIGLAGDEPMPTKTVIPRLFAFALVFTFTLLLILFTLPLTGSASASSQISLTETFWQVRSADSLAQIVLIFTSVLTVLGLLTERRVKSKRVFTPVQEREVKKELSL